MQEFGLEYETNHIDLSKDEQKQDWFTKINPNGRISAIVDNSKSPPFPVFESGAIFLYLVDHYDEKHNFCFSEPLQHSKMVQWLFCKLPCFIRQQTGQAATTSSSQSTRLFQVDIVAN
jgi:glutathione S-transferase